jgi:hypothetical protein
MGKPGVADLQPLAPYLLCASLGTFRGCASRHDTQSHVDSLPATYSCVVHDYAATSVAAPYISFHEPNIPVNQ